MKSERVFLCEWLGDITDGYNDIPWPMVHERVGYDAMRWINSRNHTDCQLLLERGTDLSTGFFRLYAEFFDEKLRTEFALRFDK